jgi:hypothetical protein
MITKEWWSASLFSSTPKPSRPEDLDVLASRPDRDNLMQGAAEPAETTDYEG